MPQGNLTPPFLAQKGPQKAALPFGDFAKSVAAQKRAQFAYDVKNEFVGPEMSGKRVEQQVDALLRKARLALLKLDRPKAEVYLRKSIALQPERADLHAQLGDVLLKLNDRLGDALKCYLAAIKQEPTNGDHYCSVGTVLMRIYHYEEAKDYFELALSMKPDSTLALSRMMYLKGHLLDWGDWDSYQKRLKAFRDEKVIADPFAFLSLIDDAGFQRLRSEALVKRTYSHPSKYAKRKEPRPEGHRIRIGYFSNDFYNHATMHLMIGMLEAHDREKFEIILYDFGSKLKDQDHRRAVATADEYKDVRSLSTFELTELAREDDLDIAIDLKGFTEGGRTDIFNERLAPVQISYLGYPGTTGVKHMDYMIADEVTIPTKLRKHYSEQIMYMPNCYQPNDKNRFIANITNTKESFHLPPDAFVFGSFNNPYKVKPHEFDIWMDLLKEVPNSVLWFYTGGKDFKEVLKHEAGKRGVDPERIIRAGKLPPQQHLARLQFCDLFLDTFYVNAHTTASDSLWAGVPMVTKLGEQFAARVAGSILKAANLPELVTTTNKEYRDTALKLATDPEYFQEIKARLQEARESAPLFDTLGYTRDFEALMIKAFERAERGEPAKHLKL